MVSLNQSTCWVMNKCDLLQVRGYPTLKLFSNGREVEDYKGGRTRKDIVAYITEKAKATRNELWSTNILWSLDYQSIRTLSANIYSCHWAWVQFFDLWFLMMASNLKLKTNCLCVLHFWVKTKLMCPSEQWASSLIHLLYFDTSNDLRSNQIVIIK